LVVVCEADPAVVRVRLRDRRGDVSDADWAVYEGAAARWESPSEATRARYRAVRTDDAGLAVTAALTEIRKACL
jgi:predicted kinase